MKGKLAKVTKELEKSNEELEEAQELLEEVQGILGGEQYGCRLGKSPKNDHCLMDARLALCVF